MSDREEALREIVDIAHREGLSAKEISDALAQGIRPVVQSSGALKRVLSYMGGILILSGLCYFFAIFWHSMSSPLRVGLTLGTGITCYAMAINYLRDSRFEKAVTPLFLLAAFFQPAGLLVALDEYSLHQSDPRYAGLIIAAIMLFQQAYTFKVTDRTVLLFTSIFFGGSFFMIALDIMGMNSSWAGLLLTFSVLVMTYGIGMTRHRDICGFWYFFSSLGFCVALFDVVENTWFEFLALLAGLGLLYLSTLARSRSLLLVSALFTLWYIGYFSHEHFANSLGWPITLIFIGFAFLGMSSLAVRLDRRIKAS